MLKPSDPAWTHRVNPKVGRGYTPTWWQIMKAVNDGDYGFTRNLYYTVNCLLEICWEREGLQ